MTGSYLLIFPVPKSIRKPGQNRMFHKDLALNSDSMMNGVSFASRFCAMFVLVSSVFSYFSVGEPPNDISATFTLLVAAYSWVPASPVKVTVCLDLVKTVMHDENSSGHKSATIIFFMLDGIFS